MGGRSIELFDADGLGYIDASGGAAVSCIGQSSGGARGAARSTRQNHTAFFTTEIAEQLAGRQVADLPDGSITPISSAGGRKRCYAEDDAPVFRREGGRSPPAYHRAPSRLPWQYLWERLLLVAMNGAGPSSDHS